jgi:hypothetical protein
VGDRLSVAEQADFIRETTLFLLDHSNRAYRKKKYANISLVQSALDSFNGDENHPLVGTYMLLYSNAEGHLKPNKHFRYGAWGEACIVKLARQGWTPDGFAAYEDIADDFLRSGLWEMFLTQFYSEQAVATLGTLSPSYGTDTPLYTGAVPDGKIAKALASQPIDSLPSPSSDSDSPFTTRRDSRVKGGQQLGLRTDVATMSLNTHSTSTLTPSSPKENVPRALPQESMMVL